MSKRLVKAAINENDVREYIASCSGEKLLELGKEIFHDNGNCDWADVYDMVDFDEMVQGLKPFEIMTKIFYGGETDPNQAYVHFDGNGNIESIHKGVLFSEIRDYADELADEYIDRGHCDCDDELDEMLKQ